MTTIKILGDRLLIRRKPSTSDSPIALPEGVEIRNPHFEAVVVQVGTSLSEDLSPGDEIVVQALHTQLGSQPVDLNGQSLEIISTLDVAIVRPRKEYHIKEFRPGKWHVVNRAGQPLYDDPPDAQDKPVVFIDEDIAQNCADRLNAEKE